MDYVTWMCLLGYDYGIRRKFVTCKFGDEPAKNVTLNGNSIREIYIIKKNYVQKYKLIGKCKQT